MSDLATVNDIGPESQREGQRGPGRWLRDGREARRWTQEHVASQLHLPVRVIEALEQDDFHRLPPPTFVRGYLRNYARLVNLPEQEVINQYRDLQGKVEDSGLPSATAQTQVTSSDRRVRWVTYLVALIVLALPVIYWTQWSQRPSDTAPTLTELESTVQGAAEQSSSIEESVPPPAEPLRETARAPKGEPAATVAMAPPAAPEPVAENGAVSEPDARSAEDMALVDVAPPSAPSTQPGGDVQRGTQQPAAGPPGADTVVLRFEDESWAQVTDAEGRRLVFETGSKGSTKTIQGKPPFRVVLGRPSAVKVEYNGESFDPMLREKKGVARFDLGAPRDQTGSQQPGSQETGPQQTGSQQSAPTAEPGTE